MERRFSAFLFLLLLALPLTAQEGRLELKLDDMTVVAPARWEVGHQEGDSVQLHIPLEKPRIEGAGMDKNPKPTHVLASQAGMLVIIERRRDHAEAVRRLAEIASEQPEPPELLLIGGWPALQRTFRAPMPQTGEESLQDWSLETTFTTTAIAVDTRIVRFDTMMAPDAPPDVTEESLAIAHETKIPRGPESDSRSELRTVRKLMKAPPSEPHQQPPHPSDKDLRKPDDQQAVAGVAVNVQTGVGEVEVATNNGQNVVVAANSGFSFSADFGATYTSGGGTPCNQTLCDGDPSLAVGASGNIYYAWIGGPTLTTLGNGVSRSTNNGQTFAFRGMAATCPGITTCTVADQEHIAADRANAATGGGDLIYNVWRDFATIFSLRISCSSDSGTTWTAGAAIGAGDFPRVSVGGDGFVYVAYASGGNMMLHKYSNCDAGLTAQTGWPLTVSAFNSVVCPVPGLDRCNRRNILASPKVAVDDIDPNHVYYSFVTSTGAGNEDVMVFDSNDGGATFPRSVRVNNAVTARRFMSWISSYGGVAQVSWYDRRTASAANNDLTRFYIGGAAVRGPNLVALPEVDLSGNNDPHCTNWPCATDRSNDSESCSAQPQLGGSCLNALGGGSGTRCDFTSTACPAGETCSVGRGCPKYGDYNGNAAGGGLFFSAWSSTTPPAAIGGAAGTLRVYASADRVPSDFYVRDWNSAPNFDNGAQPSTSAVFWATSDVWSENTTTPSAPAGNGSIVGDPPSRTGSNYLFARVSRRAPAAATAPSATVTVNFFRGDYGLGSPFVAIGSETLTFGPGDTMLTTPAHAWTVPATASAHLCVAVQIVAPNGDTFSLPSIAGLAPGPADPLILIDNNKAQRNLADTVGTAGGTELISQIFNSQKEGRTVRLRVLLPFDQKLQGSLEVIGGEKVALDNKSVIELGHLAPGEPRWLRLRATDLQNVDKPVTVHVFEDTDPPSNGFTLLVERGDLERVVRRNLTANADLFHRLGELKKSRAAMRVSELALEARHKLTRYGREGAEEVYLEFLREAVESIKEIVHDHLSGAEGSDPFDIGEANDRLHKTVAAGDVDRAAAANTALVERFDAHLTQLLLVGRKR